MPKIQKIGSSLAVTIPFYIARIKGWKKGQELVFNIDVKTGKVAVNVMRDVAGCRL